MRIPLVTWAAQHTPRERSPRLTITATRYVLWLRVRTLRDALMSRDEPRDEYLVLNAQTSNDALAETLDLYRVRLRRYDIMRAELRVELVAHVNA